MIEIFLFMEFITNMIEEKSRTTKLQETGNEALVKGVFHGKYKGENTLYFNGAEK